MIRNSCRKVFLGRNVAINLPKINQLIDITRKEITTIIDRHADYF
jgi:hypothetical protein